MKNTFKATKATVQVPDTRSSAGPEGAATFPPQNPTGQVLAYAPGTNVHIVPGRERPLPHEAWHVVQKKQGRVRPTMQMKGAQGNDDPRLEMDADARGLEAAQSRGNLNEKKAAFRPQVTVQRGTQDVLQLTKRKRLLPLSKVEDTSFYENYGALSATNVATEDTGTDAEYVIGPRSGGYLGSGPQTSIMANTINWLDTNLPTANKWIRGHLLNDWLGGKGTLNDNLAPMSHTTNQQWNRNFEQKMKAITERLDSFYANNSGSNYFVLTGYVATASGNYNPAALLGVNIPDQFDGAWYYGAYDRTTGNVDYTPITVTAAFNELDQSTTNAITGLENTIVTTTMQIH